MKDLIFHESPFHVTHEKEVADKLCEETDREIANNSSEQTDDASFSK